MRSNMSLFDVHCATRSVYQGKEGAPAGSWYVCPEYLGRRSPPMTICDSSVDKGLAATTGSRDKTSTSPFRYPMRVALDSAEHREGVFDEYKHRCDPLYVCKDIFDAGLRVVGIRCPSTPVLRSGSLRVKKHLHPANPSGLENAFGR